MVGFARTAAAYIRVSTEDQTEYSPAAQLRELREYAADHGLFLDERYIYADEGISGRKAEKRPAFMRMIADARRREHPFDVILVHKFDRFARSREDSVVYKAMLKRAGVEVLSIREPISEGNYSGVMEAIYESFAEAYSINLGQEVKKGMTEKARRGELQSNPSFGYRAENHALVPNEAEAPIVVEIFQRFAAGEPAISIAKRLNARGITTHRGNLFENRTIEYILQNPVYIGKLRWNPSGRTRRRFDDPALLVADARHRPLIDSALWEAVQRRIAAQKDVYRYHNRPNYDRKHWLSGIVRCAACGATLVWTKPHYFRCNNYIRGRCRYSQHIAAEKLAEALLARLRLDLRAAEPIGFRAVGCNVTNRRDELRQSLARLEKRSERLTDAYLNAAMELDEYKSLRDAIAAERTALTDALAALERDSAAADPIAALRPRLSEALRTLTDAEAAVAEKYAAANRILARCVWDKSALTLNVTYRVSW